MVPGNGIETSVFDANVDLEIRRRNCDGAVERSPSLKGLYELSALLLGHTFQEEPEPQ